MRDILGPGTILGYCTNVHAGPTYAQTQANLQAFAVPIRQQVSPDHPMGVGLWLAHEAAQQLHGSARVDEFANWLREHNLLAYTLNGFPFGNFHEQHVKHKVYHPQWSDQTRLHFTIQLADILVHLLGEDDKEGSISTLPIGWRETIAADHELSFAAAQNLIKLCDHLAHLETMTGKLIHVDLEPEPGCYLDTSQDVVDFFKDELYLLGNEHRIRRYLRVCHDICHAAVMFEPQEAALNNYKAAGIEVGKIQISSAVKAPFDRLDDYERVEALEQLRQFREERYLHQTVAKMGTGHFYEDLPQAIAEFNHTPPPTVEWRTHFHVPLFLQKFGLLESTQHEVLQCLKLARELTTCNHYEVETYAWSVLPKELKLVDLVDGIAQEMKWVKQHRENVQ